MKIRLIAAIVLLLCCGTPVWAVIVNGVDDPTATSAPTAPPRANRVAPPPAGATVIDFDGMTQPCLFLNTTRLTTEFAAQGVTFAGPGGNDGGAVIDQCGNFGVADHSSPNFLAFNTIAVLSDGGTPQGPETLTFSPPVDSVQINAGVPRAGTIQLECFDSGAVSLGSDSLTAAATLETLAISAAGIASCELSFTGDVAVFDDLAFEPADPVVTLPALAFLALAAVLAIIGGWAVRRGRPCTAA